MDKYQAKRDWIKIIQKNIHLIELGMNLLENVFCNTLYCIEKKQKINFKR